MHRVLVLAFLGLMLASAARAADVAPRRGYAPPPPRCANFSGFYLGGQLGWGYYDTTFSDRDGLGQSIDTGLPNSVNATTNRVNLGPLAGYTFQSGCTVYGFEADWSWTSLRAAEHSLDGGQGVAGVADLVTVTSKLQWFGTLRARTGIVVDNLMLYATGGIACANFDRAPGRSSRMPRRSKRLSGRRRHYSAGLAASAPNGPGLPTGASRVRSSTCGSRPTT